MKTYPKMKDSGIEGIGDIPSDWKCIKLKYACRINPPKTELSNLSTNSKVSFLPMEKINIDGTLELEEEKELHEVKDGFTYFKNNDLVVAKITPCFENGKGALCENLQNGVGFGTTELHVLRPLSNFDSLFTFYWTRSHPFMQTGESSMYGAAGQKRVSTEFIQDFVIAYPISNIEQNQIGNFLKIKIGEIDYEILKNEQTLELVKEKKRAMMNKVLTKGLDDSVLMKDSGVKWIGNVPEHWEVRKIKTISKVKRGASPRPIDDTKYFDENGEYAWVRISDVTASKMFLEKTIETLSDLGASLSVKLEPNQIFVSNSGTVGVPCITSIKCCIHDGFVYFPNFGKHEQYYYYIFELGECYKGLGNLVTQINLNTEIVENIIVPVPPQDERSLIFIFLKEKIFEIDSLISKIENQSIKLKQYRQSLITSTVSGKIDVRVAIA